MPERPTRENYSHKIADEKKRQKRLDAERRQAARDKRTTAQQIALIKQRPGASLREMTRLAPTSVVG